MKKSPFKSSSSLFIFLAILLLGLISHLFQHNLFLQLQHKVDTQAENERNRIVIGEMIINDLRKVEANFYRLPTSTEINAQQIFFDTIMQTISRIRKALHVIEKGGAIDFTIPLNLPELDEMVTTVHYQPTTGERYILEIIDLRPKLVDLEEKTETLMRLVSQRDKLRSENKIEEWAKATNELKMFLKGGSPNFVRIIENANQLFYKSQSRLDQIQPILAEKQQNYRLLETVLASLIILIVLVLAGLVYKRQSAMVALEKSEAQLSAAFTRFSRVLDGLDNIIYVADIKTHEILFTNRYTKDKYGDVIGQKCYEIFRIDGTEGVCPCCLNNSLLVDNATGGSFTLENQQNDKWFEIHGQVINWDEGREAIHILVFDITDRKLAQQEREEMAAQLHRAQKMKAIGMMAGGVAHDLNNIMAGIVSYPDMLLMDLPETSPMHRPLNTIKKAGERAAAVVEDLLTVARGIAKKKEPIALNCIVEQYLQSPEFGKLASQHPQVKCSSELAPDLSPISGSPIHISKVLMNLVTNAVEAIKEQGNVHITTYNDKEGERTESKLVVLKVSDDGPGIRQKDIERIFEPFYTKKVMGRSGTGLGLAVVWNAVQEHGGTVNVKSDASGTIFEVRLPATTGTPRSSSSVTPQKLLRGRGEHILVIDDDPSQREVASGMLERLGYAASEAANGEEGVAFLHENSVDLILLDMIMPPGMGGRETYEKILARHPGQKAVLVSGFSASEEVKQAISLGASSFIKKPYTVEELASVVYKALT
ncbi:MAG: response regulator [Desulfobulbaceae bacterium]|nr:response regulator [Desulfobulbaceae bacterium]